MRVDFYQLSQSSVEEALPALAAKMIDAGARALVVSADIDQLARISDALWATRDQFLAHGPAGGPHDSRQPILLTDNLEAPNGASFLALADGLWREGAEAFERVFLLFGPAEIDAARGCWRMLGEREDVERKFWVQDGGKWRPGP